MAGEKKVIRKRTKSSSRPRSRGLSVNIDELANGENTLTSENEKYVDGNIPKRSVLFHGRGYRINLESDISMGKENKLPASKLRTRSRLQSAKSIVSTSGHETDSPPRLACRQRRSVSAHPTIRSHSVTQSPQKHLLTRSSSKSCLSLRNSYSEDLPPSVRSSCRNRQKVERLRLRSTSTDSSDCDESPRTSSRTVSLPLSPETIASMTSLAEHNKQVWDQFSNHVRLIDDSTGLISKYPRKTFSSSSIFQKAMHDLYGNAEYGKSRGFLKLREKVGTIATCASRLLAGAKRLNLASMEKDIADDDLVFEERVVPSKETVENAKRGWRILRQYVQEMAAEKRMRQSTLSWTMLSHTIRGLSNMERTRYELYQKYGLVPIVRSDGTVIQENTMLSERTRAALAAKASKPAPPTRLQSAPAIQRNQSYKTIGGFKAPSIRTESV